MPRALLVCSRKTNRTQHAMYVLGLLLCAGVIVLCCAVLCCAWLCSRFNDNILVHTTAVLLLLYTGTVFKKMENEGSALLYKMLEVMLALANSVLVCLLALSSCMYGRESTAKHGTARHRTAGHDTARRCAAPLSYL